MVPSLYKYVACIVPNVLTVFRHMLQVFLSRRCIYFIHMLQVFHGCCNMFHIYVTSVSFGCYICFAMVTSIFLVFQTYVASVLTLSNVGCKCFI
jgi:hypothetical protein